MTASPNFRKGADNLPAATEYTSPLDRVEFWKIEDGDKDVLRFVTDVDEWITVDQFFAPTKPKPASWEGDNWPKAMPAVDRYDPAFAGIYNDNWVIDNKIIDTYKNKPIKSTPRTWAWAVKREPRVDESGQIIGYADATKKVTVDDDEVVIKHFVMVNMGKSNFFGPLNGFAAHFGTIVDRDYAITREGKGKDTEYRIIPLDPIPLAEGNRYDLPAGTILDLRQPAIAEKYVPPVLLGDVIAERASDEYYAQWFIPQSGDGVAAEQSAPAQTKSDVDPAALAAMRDRIQKSAAATPDTAPAPAKAAPAKTAPAKAAAPTPAGGMQDFS